LCTQNEVVKPKEYKVGPKHWMKVCNTEGHLHLNFNSKLFMLTENSACCISIEDKLGKGSRRAL